MIEKKSVAIIGAEALGLAAAKAMMEQDFEPFLFEKYSQLGSVCSSIKANVSKYTVSFSDYPWASTAPLFPSCEDIRQYLNGYAEQFNLNSKIRFNTKVLSAKQLNNKKWHLKWMDTESNTEFEDTFDYLIVSSGIFSKTKMPEIQGDRAFKGVVIHSRDYAAHKGSFDGKKVVVVGHSNSGCDISADLALDGASVLNVFNKPYWIIKRLLALDLENPDKILPYDYIILGRKMNKLLESVPTNEERNLLRNQILSIVSKQNLLDNKDLHVNPDDWDTVNMAISDSYIDCVKNGLVVTKKSEIKSFTENEVCFTDGTYTEADVVIWCTGYNLHMDFFDESVLKSIEYDSSQSSQPIILYKNTFPRNVDNLAFVGMPRDPTYGFGELQGRWISEVFSNKRKLPNKKQIEDALNKQKYMRKIQHQSEQQHEDFVTYMDDIAKEIDVLPDFEKIKETDEDLYRVLCNGLAAPVHYRLNDKKDLALKVLNEINEVIASL